MGLIIRRVGTFLARLLVSFLPALLVISILHFRYGTNIYEHVPVWNDEVGYWHQAATFAAVGFQGGYYSYNENTARATWTRFGVHGPWYPMLYGTLGRLLGGWELVYACGHQLAVVHAVDRCLHSHRQSQRCATDAVRSCPGDHASCAALSADGHV